MEADASGSPPTRAPRPFLVGAKLGDGLLGLILGALPVLSALSANTGRTRSLEMTRLFFDFAEIALSALGLVAFVLPLTLVLVAFFKWLKPYRVVRKALALALSSWLVPLALLTAAITLCAVLDPWLLLAPVVAGGSFGLAILVLREAFRP